MSGGVVFRHTVTILMQSGLPDIAVRSAVAALEAARPGPLTLLYEAGFEAGLERSVLLDRAAAAFLSFAAGNLADDLVDGDCDYLPSPYRDGPFLQFVLENLVYSRLAGAGLTPQGLVRAGTVMAIAAAHGLEEVRADAWDATLLRELATAMSGNQWAGYLVMLWDGTRLADRAEGLGRRLGAVLFGVEDIRSGDVRFTSLTSEDRRAIVHWLREEVDSLEREELKFIGRILAGLRELLAQAAAPFEN